MGTDHTGRPARRSAGDRQVGAAPGHRRSRYAGTHPRRFDQRYKELDPQRYPEVQVHVRGQGRTPAGSHVPILVNELLAFTRPAAGEIVVDCTLGCGGQAQAVLQRLGSGGRLIGLDVDAAEAQRAAAALGAVYAGECKAPLCASAELFAARAVVFHTNFAGFPSVLRRLELDGCDVLYADLGVSSVQIDDPSRGFSYKHDGPLDMRMDRRIQRSAADLVNTLSPERLTAALRDLADEPHAVGIAAAIVRRRRERPFSRTRELSQLICDATQQHGGRLPDAGRHPAARAFQALRILVNDELAALRELLRVAPACLRPGGRIAIISFHSGEDRLVKHAFRDGLRAGLYEAVSDAPVTPSPAERRDNPRSASAKLRWARRATVS